MLHVSNLTKSYGDTLVLDGVSLIINAGDQLGLVGPNGCGKSTLLRLIACREAPDRGSVRATTPNLRLGYLEQGLEYAPEATLADLLQSGESELEVAENHVAQLAEELAVAAPGRQAALLEAYGRALAELEEIAGRQTALHDAEAVLAGLDLADLPLETPVGHLSGGQKTRLGLARLLLHNPQLLLLDEPTNHLDIQALEWLESWLQNFRGAVLVVSHDRTFLDRTVNTILELDPASHQVTAYPGSYGDYLAAKLRERERQWTAYKDQQERVARMQAGIRQLSNYAGSIELGTTDYSIRKIAKGIARRAVVQKRRLERELAEEQVEKPGRSWQLKLEFVDTPASGQDVIRLEELAAGYDGRPIFHDASQVLQAGERVALLGANGSGKTTLLRAIRGELAPMSGRVQLGANVRLGSYAQEQENLDPASTPFETLRRVAAMSETDVRSFLHYFLFSGDQVFTRVGDLSYGERARLMLARLVAAGCNCLLLDEPINHLDIPSRTQFEEAMATFEGTVLAVVHDRYFVEHFASRIWVLEEGTLHSYVDLEDWQRAARGEKLSQPALILSEETDG